MDVICKNTQRRIRTLTDDERNAVIQYVLGETANPYDIPVQPLLSEWYDNERWLKCDCHLATDSNPKVAQSIEHLKQKDNGTLYFARNRSAPMHLDSCAFHDNNSSAPTTAVAHTRVQSRVLNFHSVINTEADATDRKNACSGTRDSGESARRSSLGSLLLTLADEAQINRLNLNDTKVSLSGLTQAVSRFEAADGISLGQVFATSLSSIQQTQLGATLRTLANGWPQKSRPYGLMAGTVKTLDELAYLGSRTTLGHAHTPGPYLVLATFTNKTSEPHNRFYYLMRVATMPIVDQGWPMPVESSLEREVAITLKRLMNSLFKEYGVRLRLDKPLLDTPVGTDNIRCDFILSDQACDRTLAIEVMGFKNAEYRERKERQVQLMRTQYTDLIEVEMSGTEEEKKRSLKNLNIAVRRFFG